MSAAKEGHLDVLESLINHPSVDVNQPCGYTGEVALCAAASQGQLGSCQILIKTGKADVNLINEKNGNSPLFIAVKEGHYAIVDLLLNNGASVERYYNATRGLFLLKRPHSQLLLILGVDKVPSPWPRPTWLVFRLCIFFYW